MFKIDRRGGGSKNRSLGQTLFVICYKNLWIKSVYSAYFLILKLSLGFESIKKLKNSFNCIARALFDLILEDIKILHPGIRKSNSLKI